MCFIFYNSFFFYIKNFLLVKHCLKLKLVIKVILCQDIFTYDIHQLNLLNYNIFKHNPQLFNIFQKPLNYEVVIIKIMLSQYEVINN